MQSSPELSLYELAEAHLTTQRHSTVLEVVRTLIAQAVADAAQDEDDAGKYALLAAQLIDAYKLNLSRP